MPNTLLCYPRCTTCGKARAWLDEHGIEYVERNIKEDNPTEDELRDWLRITDVPLVRLWNTRGMSYRSLGLSKRRPMLTEDEQISLLSQDGMLVRRPIFLTKGTVLVGFDAAQWSSLVLG